MVLKAWLVLKSVDVLLSINIRLLFEGYLIEFINDGKHVSVFAEVGWVMLVPSGF